MSAESDGELARGPEQGAAAANCNVHSNDAVEVSAAVIPTQETYAQFQFAYDYLNRELFENKLPNCLITLQRQRSSYGYFSARRFGRKDGERTDEITLNPQHFPERTTEDSLSTLVHEMKHLEQHHFGKPGRGRYHNKPMGRHDGGRRADPERHGQRRRQAHRRCRQSLHQARRPVCTRR